MPIVRAILLAALAVPTLANAADAGDAYTQQAIHDLKERARYPAGSQLLKPGDNDPLLAERIPVRALAAGPGGAAPVLSAWASTASAEAGQTVDFFASLQAAPNAARLSDALKAERQASGAQIMAKLSGEHSGVLAELHYADDGKEPDHAAGDGIYSARVVLPAAHAPAPGTAEALVVTVHARNASGEERTAVGGLQLSNPGAHLTGSYRDRVRDGNLVIAAEAEVFAAGRYRLSGTLADSRAIPFVSAQVTLTLKPGKQVLELPFYGLAFHDRKIDGPVILSTVALDGVSAAPIALGPVLHQAYVTQPVKLAALTRKPFNDPKLLDTARRLAAAAAKKK
jgi:hypothetical protein